MGEVLVLGQLRTRGAAAAPRCWLGGVECGGAWVVGTILVGCTARAAAAPEPALKRGAPDRPCLL